MCSGVEVCCRLITDAVTGAAASRPATDFVHGVNQVAYLDCGWVTVAAAALPLVVAYCAKPLGRALTALLMAADVARAPSMVDASLRPPSDVSRRPPSSICMSACVIDGSVAPAVMRVPTVVALFTLQQHQKAQVKHRGHFCFSYLPVGLLGMSALQLCCQ